MACFIAPLTEAVVVKLISKHVPEEKRQGLQELSTCLIGGSALLAVEHIVHGEVQLTFPFLTAFQNPLAGLMEVGLVGGAMCMVVTSAWYLYRRYAVHI